MAQEEIAVIGFKANTTDITKADKKLDALGNTGDKTTSKLGSLVKMVGVLGASLIAMGSTSKLLAISREFDVLNAQLITATGSAQNATVAFKAIQKFAADTPYDLAQATRGFTQLVNLGLTPSEAAMTSYGNTASAMGKDLSQMIEAVADATTGEFERLKEFGIKSKSEGDNVSFTFRGITQTVKKEAASIEGYLMALGDNEFAGAMAQRAATLDGAISNLGDTWDAMFLAVSNSGFSEVMQNQVRGATDAIQLLTDQISSGALSNSFDALTGRLDGLMGDFTTSFNIISAIIGESTNGWGESVDTFFDNMLAGFKVLPEMTRFFVQASAVSLAEMVHQAEIYGDAFVEVFKTRLDFLVESSILDGKKIANALNPFSDSMDFWSERNALDQKYVDLQDEIMSKAREASKVASDLSNSLINDYALESVAATDNYEKRIELSDQLLANYLKEKNAVSDDSLGQFKVVPGGVPESIAKVNTEYSKWIASINDSTGTIAKLEDEITNVWLAMDAGDIDTNTGLEYIDQMEGKIKSLQKEMSGADMFESISDGAIDALSAIQGLSAQGSDDYKKLGIAIQGVTVAQDVMALAASVSMANITGVISSAIGLLGMLDSIGDTFNEELAIDNQALQGLNVWGDKAESIASSVDITADATGELVTINTGMLNALNSLQNGISSVASLAIRGLSTVNLTNSDMGMIDFSFLGGTIGNFIGNWLGGSSSTVDSGVQFGGGLTGDADIMGFQTTEYKKWKFGSKKTREDFYSLGNDINAQFNSVFMDIADSVAEGASALGLSEAEITKSINDFEIEVRKISLKDLSSDEQAAEISAVFSEIFNNVAGATIPFLEKFQQTGEGLGETLARIATQVQITEVLADSLGVTLGDKLADPELFATIADNLSTMVGGIEEFATKTAGFIDAFAPDAVKFEMATEGLANALSAVGLEVPDSAEGFWELMNSLNGTTEAGQAQIAALLNAQGIASDYYGFIDDMEADRLSEASARESELSSFNSTLSSTVSSIKSAISSLFGSTVASQMVAGANLDEAILAARGGDYSKAIAFDAGSVGSDSSSFSNASDFAFSQAVTGNKLNQLATLVDGQKTYEDLMLHESKSQSETLTALSEQNTILSSTMALVAKATAETAKKLQELRIEPLDVRITA